jgi:hypothetical protein
MPIPVTNAIARIVAAMLPVQLLTKYDAPPAAVVMSRI